MMRRKKEKQNSFLYYFMISISIILFLFILQKKIDSVEEIHGLYSKNTVEIRTSNIDDAELIECMEEIDTNEIMIVSEGLHPFLELKGIYFDEKLLDIPIIKGRFFSSDESQGKEDKIVVGYQYEEEIHERNNKKYYLINGEEYEVVGIIGEQYGSRFNTMIFLPFKTATEKYGTAGVYLLDEAEGVLAEELLKSGRNWTENISVRKLYSGCVLDFFEEIKEDNGMLVIYLLMMLLITTCSFLGTNYCMNINSTSIKTYKILGMSEMYIIKNYVKKYIVILCAAFVASIAFGIALGNILEIHLVNYYIIYIGLFVFFLVVNIEFLLKIVISVRRVNLGEKE